MASDLCRSTIFDAAKRQAIIEATMLVVASRAYLMTDRNGQPTTQTSAPHFLTPADFEEDVAHLERVSLAVAHSPIVAEVVAARCAAWRLDDAA